MILCHCRALSDRTIRAAIEEGAGEDDLARRCGAGSECGGCLPALRRLVAEYRLDDVASGTRRLAHA
jgi:bacterioferritin-associated ferredoxin